MEHRDNKDLEKDFAIAKSSATPAEWQRGDDFDVDDEDISTTLHGAKAITGKAVYSANQASRNTDHSDAQQEKHEAEEREARELMHLAAWNAEKTFVGGVEMTNEEAQHARQHIIDHEDEYADRAVREGRIRADEKDEFKYINRQIEYLKELEGRGIATDQQKKDCGEYQQSRIGRATQDYAAEAHALNNGLKLDLNSRAQRSNEAVREISATPLDDKLFKSAPEVGAAFNKSASPTPTTDPIPEQPSVPVAARVAAMGMGV